MAEVGPCIPGLLIGALFGELIKPAKMLPFEQIPVLWEFAAPIGGVIGFLMGALLELVETGANEDPPKSPPSDTPP